MAKIISVSDDVYEYLTKMKGKDSYSVLIRNIITKTSNKEKVMEFFGKGGVDEGKLKELAKAWKKWSEGMLRLRHTNLFS